MSLFGDLKRVFFGAKSVAKHQAQKAGQAARNASEDAGDAADDLLDATKQAASELAAKAPEYIAKGKDALENLGDKVWRDAEAAVDKAKGLGGTDRTSTTTGKDPFSDLNLDLPPNPREEQQLADQLDALDPDTPDPAAPPKKKLIDFESEFMQETKAKAGKAAGAAAKAGNSALDAAAKAGAAAKEQADKLAGKIGEVSEVVGAKVLEKGDKILDRAAETGAGLKEKFDGFVDHASKEAEKMRMEDAIEDAKRAAEQAEARARAFDGKESARDTSESILTGTDSFFDRAGRFADGDYQNEGGKDMTIRKNPTPTEKPKGGMITGFDDADGDGDSLIDDAILEEEDDNDNDNEILPLNPPA